MKYIDAEVLRAVLPWPVAIAAIEAALATTVHAPLRTHHCVAVTGAPEASLLLMPAWRTDERLGVKLVTVFPGNSANGVGAVSAVYILFDATSGLPLALLEGDELTARRTAAASALGARHLARADARHLVMVGAGRIARSLIEAHCTVRSIERISVWNRTPERAERLVRALQEQGYPAQAVSDLASAVSTSDIVSCATLSVEPLVLGQWLRPGTHVDLVGAFRRNMREADDALIARADVLVVDQRTAALAEGGDIVQAIERGAVRESDISADLHELVSAAHPGRTSAGQITVFKSVGFALEDLAAAEAAYRAVSEGAGLALGQA